MTSGADTTLAPPLAPRYRPPMIIDIAAGIVALIAAYFGWASGTLLQLGRIVIVAVAAVAARILSVEAALFHNGKTGIDPTEATVLWFFLLLGGIWAVLAFALHKLTEDLRDAGHERETPDKLGGAIVGAAKGLGLTYVVLTGLVTVFLNSGRFDLPYVESHVGRLAVNANLVRKAAAEVIEYRLANPLDRAEEPTRKEIGRLPKPGEPEL